MKALDEAGSVLIGAWEVYIGNEAGSAVWQLRQFVSMAAWETHQDRVRADATLSAVRQQNLYPHLDEINTSILRLADGHHAWQLSGSPSTKSGNSRAVISNSAPYGFASVAL